MWRVFYGDDTNQADEEYGLYGSRGEAVRDAVRRLELLVTLTELQKKAEKEGIKREELLRELEAVKNGLNLA